MVTFKNFTGYTGSREMGLLKAVETVVQLTEW